MTKAQYLLMCEQLGNEPVPEEIPADYTDFPFIVQQAMNIFSILPDNWEGMSGTYMGKDYSILPFLMDEIYDIDNKQQMMRFLLMIGNIIMKQRSEEQKRRQQKHKSKSKKGGTHVQG